MSPWALWPCGHSVATRADVADHACQKCTTPVPELTEPSRTPEEALDELVHLTEEMGLYETKVPWKPGGGDRLAVDAKGYVWWHLEEGGWSMARINPDNSPIPQPVTYYEPTTAARPDDDTAAALAWDEGYAAAERDALNQPYSDHPAAATWRPTPNPYRTDGPS